MYSFRQRSDTVVLDEPLYGHYLKRTRAPHPALDDVLAQLEQSGERIVRETLLGPFPKPVAIFKNMAHHLSGLERSFLNELDNVLLIRDPEEMLPSLTEQLPEPTLRDTGLAEQVELLEHTLNTGKTPVVIDAKRLLLDPEMVLRRLCGALELPFETAMLAWPAGPKPEDGVWAPYWYKNVHASSGFAAYAPKTEPFPEHLRPLLTVCDPLYDKLLTYAL